MVGGGSYLGCCSSNNKCSTRHRNCCISFVRFFFEIPFFFFNRGFPYSSSSSSKDFSFLKLRSLLVVVRERRGFVLFFFLHYAYMHCWVCSLQQKMHQKGLKLGGNKIILFFSH